MSGGRHQRSFKNYLLDPHFQLKYTGYLVLIALALSAALGIILWRTSDAVISQSQKSVSLGEEVVKRGRDVVEESKKVSQVVKMNIVKDPDYKDNPALREAFDEDAKKQDEVLNKQQEDLEAQATRLKEQSTQLAEQRSTVAWALTGVLVALVLLIGFAGIIVTHRVAGPIFKMKRHLREVGEGTSRFLVPCGKAMSSCTSSRPSPTWCAICASARRRRSRSSTKRWRASAGRPPMRI